ncbi:CopG family transcriptional regulator [Halorhabdus sp. CBA1104]|uniref:double zinc ribbon domain-containing protein n=1 Tax=unclassified Halorhabdus TaxID=2621901 RepID=UPI0012B2A00D|nr:MULTISPECIES: zinc ribbon domain-containing protein [unclassified Halorhabdus]QGN06150.1 CopG family transcriptional regulator [Halorhabdus sp. CBA1104]
MSKITFRADDDLVDRLEEFDASKSEVMREALRAYLDGETTEPTQTDSATAEESLDELIAERVDAVLEERRDRRLRPQPEPQDVNVNISLEEAVASSPSPSTAPERATEEPSVVEPDEQPGNRTCSQCGETVSGDHVYCPNCGEKASRRIFCDCGDELRSDWAFCPSCGRRTPAADVLDQ